MKLTEHEYKVLLDLPEKTKLDFLIKKHIVFEHKVEEVLGIDIVDAIWDEVNHGE